MFFQDIKRFETSKCTSGYATRFVDNKVIAPCIHNPYEFEEFFLKFMRSHTFDFVIPMGDESGEFLSRNKERIEKEFGASVAVPSYDVFEKANNKKLLMQLCQQHNLPHPKTMRLDKSNLNPAILQVI